MNASEAPTMQLPRVIVQEPQLEQTEETKNFRYEWEDYTDELWIVRGRD